MLGRLVLELLDKPVWGLAIGPSGVHLHLGQAHPDPNPKLKPRGDYALWITGGIVVRNREQVFWKGGPCPLESELAALSRLISNRAVTAADVKWGRNALRLVLDDEILLAAYPVRFGEKDYPWRIFQYRQEACTCFAMQVDGLEVVES